MEKLKGIVVDDIGGRGGEAQGEGLEVAQDFTIGIVNGAVAFIDHDEIEKVRRQLLQLFPYDVEHGGIGRDIDAAVLGDELLAYIRPARLVRQVLLEGGQCLFSQRDAINQKQDLFGVTGTHQGIDHGDTGAGLAGAGGHDQKEVALFLFDTFQHGANGADLIVAARDGCIDQLLGQGLTVAADILKPLKVITGREADDLARRVVVQIPEIDLVTVGVEAERQLATQLLLDVVAVLFGLLATQCSVLARFLRFDHGQGLAVLAEQHIVAELMTFVRGARFGNTQGKRRQDVELFDDLSGVFDVPA